MPTQAAHRKHQGPLAQPHIGAHSQGPWCPRSCSGDSHGWPGPEAQGWTIIWGVIPHKINTGVPADVLEGIFSSLEQEAEGRRGGRGLLRDVRSHRWWWWRPPARAAQTQAGMPRGGRWSPGNTQEQHDVSGKLLRAWFKKKKKSWSATRSNSAACTS